MDYTFFGIQVVIKAFRGDPLRQRLHEVIAGGGNEQSLAEKRTFYKKLVTVLNEAQPVFEMGYWDLIRGPEADPEFDQWASEIEGSMATEPAEMDAAADEVHRLSTDRDYLLVTLLFLVQRETASDRTIGERCDLPEKEYWTRQTLGHLLATVPMLSFANVQADAIYLMPGNAEDGVSWADLHSEDYQYLRELS